VVRATAGAPLNRGPRSSDLVHGVKLLPSSAGCGGRGERRAAACTVLLLFSRPTVEVGGKAGSCIACSSVPRDGGALLFFVLLELASMVGK
jgi:hypothetical protein